MGSIKAPSNSNLKYLSLITLTVQNSAVALSMRYARTRPGDMFIYSTAVVAAEFVKFLASLYLVFHQAESFQVFVATLKSQIWSQKVDTLKVCVPAFVYLVQNNLLYVSASNLDAATYQVTYQLKILTTALFAVFLLQKSLRKGQWLALLLLTLGVALVQLSATSSSSSSSSSSSPKADQNRLLGFLAALGACLCSGFAGIYFERILKGSSEVSLWVRNVQLSFLSLPLGLATCLVSDGAPIAAKGFFFGYDAFVAYLVVLNATGGLLVAMVVKYADNILKGFATSLAIVLSVVVSCLVLDFVVSFQFVGGAALVIGSGFLYSHDPKGAGGDKKKNALLGGTSPGASVQKTLQ